MKNLAVLIFVLLLLIVLAYMAVKRSMDTKTLLPMAENDLRNATLSEMKFYTTSQFYRQGEEILRHPAQVIQGGSSVHNLPGQSALIPLIQNNPPTWVTADVNKAGTTSIRGIFSNAVDKGHTVLGYSLTNDLSGNFVPYLGSKEYILPLNAAEKTALATQLAEWKTSYKNYLKRNPGYRGVKYPNYIINKL